MAARTFIAISGRIVRPERPGEPIRNPFGESLDRDWSGAEIGFLADEQAVAETVLEVRRRGWSLGVHWPLVCKEPHQPRWFDLGEDVRSRGLAEALEAILQAAGLGAEYVLFHFPWPGLGDEGVDYFALGWYFTTPLVPAAAWPAQRALAWAAELMAELSRAGESAGIEVVLEIDGPSRLFFSGPDGRDPLLSLVEGLPLVSLCVDTGRLALLALTHGQDPLALARRWYPIITHLHLHGAHWGRRVNHVPVLPTQRTEEGWAPSVQVAEELVKLQPGLRVVLEHNPARVTPTELEASHRWVRETLAGKQRLLGGEPAGMTATPVGQSPPETTPSGQDPV